MLLLGLIAARVVEIPVTPIYAYMTMYELIAEVSVIWAYILVNTMQS